MITYKTESSFKPFTVSFDIDTLEEAIAFVNACATLANVEGDNIIKMYQSHKSTGKDMRMISDKMVVDKQWRELMDMVKPK